MIEITTGIQSSIKSSLWRHISYENHKIGKYLKMIFTLNYKFFQLTWWNKLNTDLLIRQTFSKIVSEWERYRNEMKNIKRLFLFYDF